MCGETAGSLHYISGITPERARQVLNIDKGGGNPPLTYFMEGVAERGSVVGCEVLLARLEMLWFGRKPTKEI